MVGLPASASRQICAWSGISPSSFNPSSSHFLLPPVLDLALYLVEREGTLIGTVKTKDVVIVAAIRARECAHILNQTEDRHIDLSEEIHATNSIA